MLKMEDKWKIKEVKDHGWMGQKGIVVFHVFLLVYDLIKIQASVFFCILISDVLCFSGSDRAVFSHLGKNEGKQEKPTNH